MFGSCAVALAVAIGFFVHTSPSEEETERVERSLTERRNLDQSIPRHALEARFGFASNYDQLAQDGRARIELQRRSGQDLPGFLSRTERRQIEDAQARYAALALERERQLEHFKSENALLRNSVEFFPNAMQAALDVVGDPTLRDQLRRLDASTLRSALATDTALDEKQSAIVSEIRRASTGLDQQPARLVDLALRHAAAIAIHKAKTDELLNTTLRLPIEAVSTEIQTRYLQAFVRAQRTARHCGYLVSAFALLLLGSLIYAVRQQRQAAASLARANERLESAVAERTAELEAEMARRARVELELRQAQKLEAVGQLASGIAHEINTPIQYVGDSIYFLRQVFADVVRLVQTYSAAMTLEGPAQQAALAEAEQLARELDAPALGAEVPAAFERTLEGTRQVASIVRAMKTFAHTSSEKAPLDLNAAIRNTLIVARNEYKYLADVETQLGHIPDVTCNAGGIRQVLLNLVVNAAHAIADAGGNSEKRGAIRIATAQRDSDVIISVADTGTGIPDAIRERIFEPFFTTKEPGRGSGQGLAISRSIVMQHGGKLWFRSELGRGTAFFVELPIQAPAPAPTGLANTEFAA